MKLRCGWRNPNGKFARWSTTALRIPKQHVLQDAGIEIVNGDLTVPETLAACQTIERVASTVTSMPSGANDGLRRVDHDETRSPIPAEHADVKRFVYVSYSGNIRADSLLETAKRACESRQLQGPRQAVILPSYFMEVWLSPVLGFDPENGSDRHLWIRRGEISYIAPFDVADFAVAAATEEYRDKNIILEMAARSRCCSWT